MSIHFVTSNAGKFQEAQAIIPELKQVDLDLPEIQGLDPKKIIEHKLIKAQELQQGSLVVGDTSLSMSALKGLPGPLIKWFLKTIGVEGLAEIAQQKQDSQAVAKVVLGYADDQGQIQFFEGKISGRIVEPRGEKTSLH